MQYLLAFVTIYCAQGDFWSKGEPENQNPNDYGVDVSFPIHHYIKKDTFFKRRYDKWMKDCYAAYSQRECDATERARLEMSLDQPQRHYNYTELGFKKGKVPEAIYKEILAFYNENKVKGEKPENWPRGNTYVNAWEVPSYMINFEDKQLRGGWDLKTKIWNEMRPILSEWVGGKELIPTSLYGIRVYKRNAYLATHVDRLPLVTSAIIQVDQDVDEPWPIELIGHDGKAYNVTLEPGEMAMYESHTTLHGRPFPLNGTFFANVFVHFKPSEYDDVLEKLGEFLKAEAKLPANHRHSVKEFKYDPKVGGHEHDNHDQETIRRHMRDIDKENEQKEALSLEARAEAADAGEADGRTALHAAAAMGDIDRVMELLKNHNTEMLNVRDENGWQAIHEAARGGHLDVLKYLVDMGADIGSHTTEGGTVLWWARRLLPSDHEVIVYLESIGAPDDGRGEEADFKNE